MWRRRSLLQPARLADRHGEMCHGPIAARAVPVLLAWISRDHVVFSDALRSLSADLNPTFALDNMQQLPTGMRVPVVSGAGLKANDRGKDGRRW